MVGSVFASDKVTPEYGVTPDIIRHTPSHIVPAQHPYPSSNPFEVTAAVTMSSGETRALLPKAGGALAPLPRASDVGVTPDASAAKKPRSRWHVTAVGLLAPCAAALFVLVCALVVPSDRTNGAVSVRARLGTEADDFFHTQFHSEDAAFPSDASAGLGLKTHRHGAAAEGDAEADAEGDARRSTTAKTSSKASSKASETTKKHRAPRGDGEASSSSSSERTRRAKTRAKKRDEISERVSDDGSRQPNASSRSAKTSTKTEETKPSARVSKRKPTILVAVISWRDGAEEVAAMERTWLGALKGANAHMDADYRVFVGERADDDSGGRHAELRSREHRDRRGFGGDELAAALGPRGEAFSARNAPTDDSKTEASKVSSSLGKPSTRATRASTAFADASATTSDAKRVSLRPKKTLSDETVELPVGDAYEDLPAKVLAAIRYAADHDYDYVYKVDTDVFVLPEVFLKFVKTQVVDKKIDWMGSENKMYPTFLDPSIDFTDPANAGIVKANSSPSGFKCRLAREWHFGKCTDAELNTRRYAGVNPVSVDGGHGYVLSKDAAWAVSDFVFKRSDDLERHRRIDIYEDQLVSHILVKQGFLPVDYSGVAPFKVSGMTKELADDSCALADDPELGAAVGDRLRAMRDYRFESGANLYETAAGWNPATMDARMLPTSLLRVGIQPYVWSDSMVMKWEYYRDRDAIARQRDDGTYEPRSLPRDFELDPDLSNDPFAIPEFPDDDTTEDVTSETKHRSRGSSAAHDAETRATNPANPARELETFKKSLDDFGVFDRANRLSGGSDEATRATDDANAAAGSSTSSSNDARPGAWISVEELSDDPFAEPEWRGDDREVARAEVEEMLSAKREARRSDGGDEASAEDVKDEERLRRFEMEEAKRKHTDKDAADAEEDATIESDDAYDGVVEDR